jgi:hypothetical protein
MPSGDGGFTLSINRSSSPGGNTRVLIFGRPGQTDVEPDRVMPLTEYASPTILIVNCFDLGVDFLQKLPEIEAGGP